MRISGNFGSKYGNSIYSEIFKLKYPHDVCKKRPLAQLNQAPKEEDYDNNIKHKT